MPLAFSGFRYPKRSLQLLTRSSGLQGMVNESEPVARFFSGRSLAQRFWLGQSPLGHRLKVGPCQSADPWRAIVGVVGDVRQFALDREPRRTIYVPYLQLALPTMSLLVRDSTNPTALVPEIRAQIMSLDRAQMISAAKSMDDVIDESLAGIGLAAALMGSFGSVALILAAVGIYGLIAHSVSERTHEIGVRMALGAQPVDIQRLVVVQAFKLGLLGLTLGLPGALVLGRIMTNVLFGLQTLDPSNLAAVALALLTTALFSGYFPALRASHVSPLEALRGLE